MAFLKACGLVVGMLVGLFCGYVAAGYPGFPASVSEAIGWVIAIDALLVPASHIWPVLWFRQPAEAPQPPVKVTRPRYW